MTPLPPVVLGEDDFDYLSNLTAARAGAASEAIDFLEQELDRAEILPQEKLPADVVRIGSTVDYRDLAAGAVRKVMLVYPNEADSEAGKVSVLTPIGAALIGLKTGQHIGWNARNGQHRELEILAVG
ncbi:nucleoside diphosphate kinase regulator [Iodidimonas sp. SYSU 1G8]|uniref:nucleoside diphosphate kinase regulator n=1 Tax=Iodidimonas sp. SYSU 1G8 TaxID=3133967 RepID=UPI0031FF1D4B